MKKINLLYISGILVIILSLIYIIIYIIFNRGNIGTQYNNITGTGTNGIKSGTSIGNGR